jgi:hypothetical protein
MFNHAESGRRVIIWFVSMVMSNSIGLVINLKRPPSCECFRSKRTDESQNCFKVIPQGKRTGSERNGENTVLSPNGDGLNWIRCSLIFPDVCQMSSA